MNTDDLEAEDVRRTVIEQIRLAAHDAGFPDYDAESRIAGHLTGSASPDRPHVPVWKYLDLVDSDAGLTLDKIARVRFPITLFARGSSVTSIAEELVAGLYPLPIPPTVHDIVHRYRLLHEAGVVDWDDDTRTLVSVKSPAEQSAVFQAWWSGLQEASRSRHESHAGSPCPDCQGFGPS